VQGANDVALAVIGIVAGALALVIVRRSAPFPLVRAHRHPQHTLAHAFPVHAHVAPRTQQPRPRHAVVPGQRPLLLRPLGLIALSYLFCLQ
jgi:hypothetical protein